MMMNCGSSNTVDSMDEQEVQQQPVDILVVESTNMTSASASTSTSTTCNNNKENTLVAETDHQAALHGIDTKMNFFQEHAATDAEKELLEHAQESLKKHLNNVVQPIDDALFHARTLNSHHHDDFGQEIEVQFEEERNDQEIDESDGHDSDRDEAGDVVDEDELLDAEAVERARQLRDEVRSASMNLTRYKDSITKKADELWMKEDYSAAEMQTAMMPFSSVAEMKYAFLGKTKDATLKSVQVLQMVANLQKLTKQLTYLDLDKPMKSLEETVDTVEQGIASEQQPEQMSQTEKAIKSRTNEGGEGADEQEDPLSYENALPEDRLAAFLVQHAN